MKKAYDYTIQKFWSEEVGLMGGLELKRPLPTAQCPSYRQFLYVWYKYKDKNLASVKKAALGEVEFTLRHRTLKGNHTRKVSRPAERFEVDAHIADCHLVHHTTRLPIGRPTVYFVVDVFTHLIVGVAITLEPPSYIGAALALINAFTDKVEFCRQYGIEIGVEDWPSQHLCKVVVADRGELLNNIANVLSIHFNVDKTILPGYRPDMKPLVERFFKQLNEKIRYRLPGAVFGPKRRGKRDPKLDARLDVKQYGEIVVRTVLELNRAWMSNYNLEKPMIADGVKPTPLDLWEWGVRNRSGILRPKSADYVRANLLPRAKATVTLSGINFRGLEYSLPSGLSDDWQLARSDADGTVEIAYDPRLVDAIDLCDQRGAAGKYEACRLKSKHDAHLGWSWRELDLWSRSQSHGQRKHEESRRDKNMETDIRIDATRRDAEAKHKAAIHPALSKAAFLKGSADNRADARRAERQATSLIKNAAPKSAQPAQPAQPAEPPSQAEVAASKVVPFSEVTRRAREAERLRALRDR